MDKTSYRIYTKPAEVDKAVNTLRGLLTGIELDNKINSDEIVELLNWCSIHREFEDMLPFSEILPVIDKALEDGELLYEEIQDILYVCEAYSKDGKYYDFITATIQKLHGILYGLIADRILSDEEILNLSEWLYDNSFLKGTYPFDEVDSLITVILNDKKISEDERNTLYAFLSNFVDTTKSYNLNEPELNNMRSEYCVSGICSVNPEIHIENKLFCFTGTSSKVSRKEIKEIIISQGGLYNDKITTKTNYLIVGNDGNPCWAFSCYGRKVEKAIELRKSGNPIIIVHENDFWDILN